MLRTQLSDPHSQTIRQRRLFSPIAVDCIQDGCIRDDRNRQKFAIRSVESILGQFFETSPIVLGRCHGNPENTITRILVVVYMSEEHVTHAGLSRVIQMIRILRQNAVPVIDRNDLILYNRFQSLHTSQPAKLKCYHPVHRTGSAKPG